eukprot:10666630-Heterocapsa_arctica.AAC.1
MGPVDRQGPAEQSSGSKRASAPTPGGNIGAAKAQPVGPGTPAGKPTQLGQVVYAGPHLKPSEQQLGKESQSWYGKPQ